MPEPTDRLLEENRDAWESLVFALSDMSKPALACLTCSDPQTEAYFLKELQAEFRYNHHAVLDLRNESGQIHSLFRYLKDHAEKIGIEGIRPNFFLHVLGLGYQFNRRGFGNNLLDRINLERELLFQKLPFSTVFWIEPDTEKYWKKQSPDFWNWVTYDFRLNDYKILLKEQSVDEVETIKQSGVKEAVRIFISYASKDRFARDKIFAHLNVLRQRKLIEIYGDHNILIGEEWDQSLRRQLENADMVIFLLSNNALESDYITNVELPIALDRSRNDKIAIVPIILNHCLWDLTQLAAFQALPKNGRPIADFETPDLAYTEITKSIKEIAERIQAERAEKAS